MTTIESVVHNHNRGRITGQTMPPAVQKVYAAEMRGAHAMFEGLTTGRPDLNVGDKNEAERYSSHANIRIAFQPVDMGMRVVQGRPRQVLVQPLQYTYSEGCKGEYPEATPGDTSAYELEVFAVMGDERIDVTAVEDALYEGLQEINSAATHVAHLGSERLLIYESDADGSFGHLDASALPEVFEFNPLLTEVYLQSLVPPAAPSS